MTLQSAKLASETLCLLLVGGSAVYAVRDLHQTQVEARADMHQTQVQARGTISALTATLEYVNRPCMSVDPQTHKLLPDGTLCQLNQAIHDLRKIATASGKQVQQTSDVITAMSKNLDKAGDGITKLSDSLSKTADQATKLTSALTLDAQTAHESLEAFPPLLRQSTQTVAHLDAFIQSPDLTGTIRHINGMSASGDETLSDFHVWSHAWLNPDPCKTRKCAAGRIFKRAAGYLGIAADARDVETFWNPLKVQVQK